MRFSIIITLNNGARLFYEVKGVNSKVAVNKAMWDLDEEQYSNMINIEIIKK